ncbi:MAG: hypothetical protein JWR01_1864, partial [Subtercola sp.]|nr:hypothetical protein [Subtercola sp.]
MSGGTPPPPAGGSFPCTQCGSPVPANAPFCLACGTPVSSRTRVTALGLAAAQPSAGSGPTADPTPPGAAAEWRPTPVVPPLHAETILSANYGRRVLAYLVDIAFTTVLSLIVVGVVALTGGFTSTRPGAIAIEGWSFVVVVAGCLLYPLLGLLMQAFLGYSFGKRMLGLRLVRSDSFTTPGLLRMIVRSLIVGAAGLVFGVGRLVLYLSPLWDPAGRNRGWHDRIAKTWVIDVVHGPDPLRIGTGEIVDAAPAAASAPAPAPAPA